MSHIVIYIDEPELPATAVADVQKALGKGLADIRRAIEADEPVVELELFDEDHEEHVRMLRRLVKVITKHKVASRIYELPEGETMETCGFVEECRITPKVLSNILAD